MVSNVRHFDLLNLILKLLISKANQSIDLFSLPDLENPIIPQKWRDFCGFRYLPKKITYNTTCFKNSYPDKTTFGEYIEKPSNRIVGGRNVTKHESPWTVQIVLKYFDNGHYVMDTHRCTGVFLTMRHILTSGHCWE